LTAVFLDSEPRQWRHKGQEGQRHNEMTVLKDKVEVVIDEESGATFDHHSGRSAGELYFIENIVLQYIFQA